MNKIKVLCNDCHKKLNSLKDYYTYKRNYLALLLCEECYNNRVNIEYYNNG